MPKPSVDIIIPVRNNRDHIYDCVKNILSQHINSFQLAEVIVVDDASTDNTVKVIKGEFANRVTVIELPENQGRAEARNIGAKHGNGDILLFLDSDCCFTTDDGVVAHVNKILEGFDVSFGKVIVRSHGFWERYMHNVMTGRERKALAGDFMVFVSANFAITRPSFLKHEGFDSRYRHYGFEDRDLFARLIKGGALLAYTPESAVIHNADFSMPAITHKMKESGTYTSALFSKNHPKMYAKMSFSKFDVRLRPHLSLFAGLLELLFPRLLKLSSRIIDSRVFPFSVKSLTVKGISAIAFLLGTAVIDDPY